MSAENARVPVRDDRRSSYAFEAGFETGMRPPGSPWRRMVGRGRRQREHLVIWRCDCLSLEWRSEPLAPSMAAGMLSAASQVEF